MSSKLEILASLPCIKSLKHAETLIAELAARGVHLALEHELAESERRNLERQRLQDWAAREAFPVAMIEGR